MENEVKEKLAEFITYYYNLGSEPGCNTTKAQLKQFEQGFKEGLTFEQVLLYANANYPPEQMEYVRKIIKNGLISQEQIASFAGNHMSIIYKQAQMKAIYTGYLKNYPSWQLHILKRAIYSAGHVKYIEMGIRNYFSPSNLLLLANELFTLDQAKQVYEGILEGHTELQVACYANKDIKVSGMKEMKKAVSNNLTTDDLQYLGLLAQELTPSRLQLVRTLLEEGICRSKIQSMLNSF